MKSYNFDIAGKHYRIFTEAHSDYDPSGLRVHQAIRVIQVRMHWWGIPYWRTLERSVVPITVTRRASKQQYNNWVKDAILRPSS